MDRPFLKYFSMLFRLCCLFCATLNLILLLECYHNKLLPVLLCWHCQETKILLRAHANMTFFLCFLLFQSAAATAATLALPAGVTPVQQILTNSGN